MGPIKSKYSLLQVKNNYSEVLVTGKTNIGEPGYIWVPYIFADSPTTLSEGDIRYYERLMEVRKRRKKIEKIINKINGTVCNG